jgi:uncharacterized protein YfkK (UPF0435 family)
MNRKMMALKKSLIVALLLVATLFSSVFADPVEITEVNIQSDNGDYIVLVSMRNLNATSGSCEPLRFTIEELGTSVDIANCNVQFTNEVRTFNLRQLTDSYDLLKKGETYMLTVENSISSKSKAFLFGTERDTSGLGLIIEQVSVNGLELRDVDVLQLINGEQVRIDIRFSALESFEDARLRAEIEGYEHSTITDSTSIFSVVEGKTYVKTIVLNLPADMNNLKDYKLRIFGANDLSGLTFKDYTVYVDTQRHRVDVIDLVITPSSGVEPGQNVIANVRLKNRGQKSQDSVKVSVAVPSLGIVESSYVSNLDNNEVVTSDDMLLFVPSDAKAGQHEVLVTLSYADGFTKTEEAFTMTILSSKIVEEQNLLVSFKDNVDLRAGEQMTLEVVIANPNVDSKPISIVPVDNTWADVEVSPSLVMVKGGESTVFNVKVTPKDTIEGERTFTLAVKEGSNTISEITVNAYVEGGQQINWVNIALAVLLVIAIIILLSLVITIAKKKGEDKRDDDYSSTEEYY